MNTLRNEFLRSRPAFAADAAPTCASITRRRTERGFSLIELMIAMLLGLILVAGVMQVFVGVGNSQGTQAALARVLENGRFAGQRMNEELRMAGAMHCATGGTALPGAGGVTPTRSLTIAVTKTTLLPRWIPYPAAATAAFGIDPGLFVRGYECTGSTCTPALPTGTADVNIVPPVGTAVGQRLAGTDVLTIRYLADRGMPIVGTAKGADPIALAGNLNAAPLEFGPNDLAMIADCGNAEVFVSATNGANATHDAADGNFSDQLSASFQSGHDARVFNFTQDFVSVTYYVGVVADPDDAARLGGGLFRMQNGVSELVVDGVERLDLRYVVQDGDGGVHYLTAAQVDGNTPAMRCPPIPVGMPATTPATGCLWRAVQGIDVALLLDSVDEHGDGNEPFRYSPDGGGLQSYAANDKLPSGLPAGRRLRREFSFLAMLHNFSR